MGKVTRAFFLYPVVLAACVPDGADDIDTRTGNILNGQTVAATNNPGTVALYHKVRVNGLLVDHPRPCSGVLISRTFVLTALHCVTEDGSYVRSRILTGSNYAVTGPDNVAPGLTRPPSAVPVERRCARAAQLRKRRGTSVDLAVLDVNSEFPASARTLPRASFQERRDGAAMVTSGRIRVRPQPGWTTRAPRIAGARARCAGPAPRCSSPPSFPTVPSDRSIEPTRTRPDRSPGTAIRAGRTLAGTSTLAGITLQPGPPERRRLQRGHDLRQVSSVDKKARHSPGDINRDRPHGQRPGRADLALVGAATPAGIVVGLSDGAGGFSVPSVSTHPDFKSWCGRRARAWSPATSTATATRTSR